MFTMHLVLREIFDGNILERTRSYMERHLGDIDALRFQVFEHLFAKVEARGRSGNSPGVLCKNGLVRFFVVFVIRAFDVRRQRNMPFLVHDFFHLGRSLFKAQNAVAIFFVDFFYERAYTGQLEFAPHLERFARMHLRFKASLARLGRIQCLH